MGLKGSFTIISKWTTVIRLKLKWKRVEGSTRNLAELIFRLLYELCHTNLSYLYYQNKPLCMLKQKKVTSKKNL